MAIPQSKRQEIARAERKRWRRLSADEHYGGTVEEREGQFWAFCDEFLCAAYGASADEAVTNVLRDGTARQRDQRTW